MPTPSRTGTASQVNASAGDGSTSVTVPGAANLVVAFWAHWDGNAGSNLSSLTIGGQAFTITHQDNEGWTTDFNGQGVAYRVSPPTGSQTFAWTWSAGGARTEGGEIVLVYMQDGNTSDPVRDSDATSNVASDPVTLTVDTETTDLLLAFASSTGAVPALDGTVFVDDGTLNSHTYDASQVNPGVGSTTINMTNESYSSMCAISLKASEAGGGGFVPDEDYQIWIPARL